MTHCSTSYIIFLLEVYMRCCIDNDEIDLSKENYTYRYVDYKYPFQTFNVENSDYYDDDRIEKRNDNRYEKKAAISMREAVFYKKLKDIFDKEYIVQFQIPLSSVIVKTSEHRYQNELYRIVDFALLSKDNYKPVILIELNDPSHNEPRRQYRDIKVKELCAKAGIKLLTFWTSYENKPEYIEKRIRQEIDRL